jgi:hypothetical protein
VFGGGSTAVLEDFRRMELVRNGNKKTARSRWRQDKGHAAEWAAFVKAVQEPQKTAIPFDEIVCSTLATLRIDESAATGNPLPVDASAFLESALRMSTQNPSRDE